MQIIDEWTAQVKSGTGNGSHSHEYMHHSWWKWCHIHRQRTELIFFIAFVLISHRIFFYHMGFCSMHSLGTLNFASKWLRQTFAMATECFRREIQKTESSVRCVLFWCTCSQIAVPVRYVKAGVYLMQGMILMVQVLKMLMDYSSRPYSKAIDRLSFSLFWATMHDLAEVPQYYEKGTTA